MVEQQIASLDERAEPRFDNGTFVGPGTRGGVDEGFLAVNISRRGMAIQRVRRRFRRAGDLDLDHGFCWVAVPLPGRARHLKALAEVMYRRQRGPWATVGLRFRYLAPAELAALDQYLGEQEWRTVKTADTPRLSSEHV